MPYPEYKSKGGLKQDELRRRREEQQVEIRRQKREENISKRRVLLPSSNVDSDDEASTSNWDPPVSFIQILQIFQSNLSLACPGDGRRSDVR